jgi:hypothetical protein
VSLTHLENTEHLCTGALTPDITLARKPQTTETCQNWTDTGRKPPNNLEQEGRRRRGGDIHLGEPNRGLELKQQSTPPPQLPDKP